MSILWNMKGFKDELQTSVVQDNLCRLKPLKWILLISNSTNYYIRLLRGKLACERWAVTCEQWGGLLSRKNLLANLNCGWGCGKMACYTRYGSYEFLMIPFRLCNASYAKWSRHKPDYGRDIEVCETCIIYIYKICIYIFLIKHECPLFVS